MGVSGPSLLQGHKKIFLDWGADETARLNEWVGIEPSEPKRVWGYAPPGKILIFSFLVHSEPKFWQCAHFIV